MSSMPEPEEQEEEPVKKSTILLVREEELASTYRVYSEGSHANHEIQRPALSSQRNPRSISTAWSQDHSRYD